MGRPRSQEARRKVIDAAMEVVLDEGVRGFSIDEIARRSGVAKTTIYRHFPDRDELLVRAVDATVVYPEPPDTGTLRGDLRAFLESVLPNFADAQANSAHQELFAAMARDPELRNVNRRVVGRHGSPLGALWQRWRDAGEIRADITLLDMFEIVDGPFVTRALLAPNALRDLTDADYDKLIDRILRTITP